MRTSAYSTGPTERAGTERDREEAVKIRGSSRFWPFAPFLAVGMAASAWDTHDRGYDLTLVREGTSEYRVVIAASAAFGGHQIWASRQ